MTPKSTVYTKAESWKIFEAIYKRYDLLNRILSFGMDRNWRDQVSKLVPKTENLRVLDLATGTADVLITMVQQNSNIKSAHGIDLSENMLTLAQNKVQEVGLAHRIILQKGDATCLPFLDNEFDLETMAFGIRNIENPIVTLKEIYRTLKSNGRGIILEFSQPENLLINILFLFYLKIIVPMVGGICTGNFKAYYYLNHTIERFPYGETFCRMMRQCGFKDVKRQRLFMGVATIYSGVKA